MYSPKKV